MSASATQLFILLHRHEYGTSTYPFQYVPTAELPYPSLARLVAHLRIDFEPAQDEELELETSFEILTLTAADVGGTRLQLVYDPDDEDELEDPGEDA